MAEWTIYGPDAPLLGMADVRKLLGGVGPDLVRRLIREGKFPRPIRAGPQSPPQWSAVTIACWQYLSPMLVEGEYEDEEEAPTKGRKKGDEG